jgi:DNA-binding protein H-NS
MVRRTKSKVLADNRETVEAAMAYGKEKGIETVNIEIINHWEVSVPNPKGVFDSLCHLQIAEHERAIELLRELTTVEDGRRRGEIRRHINSIEKRTTANNSVLNQFIDVKIGLRKNVRVVKTVKKPKKAAPKKAAKKASPKKVEENIQNAKEIPTKEELNHMNYEEVKAVAKDLGMSVYGKKYEIVARICELMS